MLGLWRTVLMGLVLFLCPAGMSGGFAADEAAGDPADAAETPETVLDAMRKELGTGFHYRAVRCFAAASDAPAAAFERTCRHTLGDCFDAYRKQFFGKDPTRVYRVYLFKDDASFRSNAKKLFGRVPNTPFGYYLHRERALVMNIGTGGGTLVHEMFHALVDEDFPEIPLWVNEGIASLFEQCRITDEGLEGLVNWRLPIVQQALRDKKLPPLRTIMTLPDLEFYRSGGANYAAARYVMMYLQEKHVLVEFYRKLRDNFKDDRTGVRFIEELLGKKLEDVESEWRQWVMDLKR